MKAFLKMGKPISFNLDMTALLPTVECNEETVADAQSSVEMPMDQIADSLFWFANVRNRYRRQSATPSIG